MYTQNVKDYQFEIKQINEHNSGKSKSDSQFRPVQVFYPLADFGFRGYRGDRNLPYGSRAIRPFIKPD